jgi:hypothetical protein
MSNLVLGTVQFGLPYGIANRSGMVSMSEAKNILDIASANGVSALDTAVGYGESESVLGSIGVSRFKVITKLPTFNGHIDTISDWVQQQSSESRSRLGVSDLYGLMLHRPMQLFEAYGKDLYKSLLNEKAQGHTRQIGISVYSPHELEQIIPRFDFDLVQLPINLLDRRFESSGWLKKLKDRGIEVHARSVFLQGLLLMSAKDRPAKFEIWHSLWEHWTQWLAESGVTPTRACLAYVSRIHAVDKIVVGAVNGVQLREIITSTSTDLDHKTLDISCTDERLINPSNWDSL